MTQTQHSICNICRMPMSSFESGCAHAECASKAQFLQDFDSGESAHLRRNMFYAGLVNIVAGLLALAGLHSVYGLVPLIIGVVAIIAERVAENAHD